MPEGMNSSKANAKSETSSDGASPSKSLTAATAAENLAVAKGVIHPDIDPTEETTAASSPEEDEEPTGLSKGFLGVDRNWHLIFGAILIGTVIWFTGWALGYIGGAGDHLVLFTTVLVGVFMAFNIGGNDVANSFGTSVGAGTLTMKQALLVAAIFEVSGAVLAGSSVTETVRSGIVDLAQVGLQPQDFVFIMLAALLGAAVWLLVATKMGWPVSTTHAIVGGIVGAAVTLGYVTGTGGFEMVQWMEIGKIAISWVLSPLLGALAAYTLFHQIKKHILIYGEEADARMRAIHAERIAHRDRHRASFERLTELQQLAYTNKMTRDAAAMSLPDFEEDELESEYFKELLKIERKADKVQSHKALETWVPLLAAVGAVVITSMLLFKGLQNLDLGLDLLQDVLIMGMVGMGVWFSIFIFARSMKKKSLSKATFTLFSWMQVFTAAAFAFSHGSNDIANAVGPFAAILDVLKTDTISAKAAVPATITIACGLALVSGLWFIGRNVIMTVGSGLTKMHPASGFAAELSAAAVVMGASVLGLPVSSTHILIGAVLGVGMVNKAANWRLMRPIGLAWIITLPAAAGIGATGMLLLRALLG
ncbi:Low-affinity inorganic phosphate transporter 1 [Actinomyces bovis]|uniref:Phosphate transporter n=1 Tax=Actinomyces bovis TaxID=1658 RepID=A0ABY1VM37_9ACTO|nr:inorganic phosphate transporter [Actinomyces bovis]SPT53075.1 Low-affinity inorganic phosphate transporter 1 [Actinomyces bovis]VEG52971.1 Low-affinity inorganic phosphate transporter 1 [Actinomyces israelii]